MTDVTPVLVSPPVVETASPLQTPLRLSFGERAANLVAIVLPFLGLVAAIVFLWGRGFSWIELGLLLGMYGVTAIGITVGYHRLFTHRSFETNRVSLHHIDIVYEPFRK